MNTLLSSSDLSLSLSLSLSLALHKSKNIKTVLSPFSLKLLFNGFSGIHECLESPWLGLFEDVSEIAF